MAVKKSASSSKPKAKDAPAPKTKAVGVKSASAANKETAPRKTTPSPSPSPKAAASPKGSAPKKSPAAAIKLSSTQADLLGRIQGAGEQGYHTAKKAELRTLDALQERKLIKRGAKNKESGNYHYQVSNAGKKHLDANPAAPPAPAGGGGSTPPSPSSPGGTS